MRVLLTRSAPEVEALALALRALGYTVDVGPAITIVPRAIDARVRIAAGAADAWVFVSIHAVRAGLEALQGIAPPARIYAVGPATADALAARRIPALTGSGAGGAAELLERTELGDVTRQRWLVVRGEGGLPDLPATLIARGAEVTLCEVYTRVPMTLAALRAAWHAPDAIVVASGDGLDALFAAAEGAGLPVRDTTLLVPSPRVAARARSRGARRVIVCAGAGNRAVIDALRNRTAEENT